MPTAQSAVFYPVSNALLVLTSFDRSAAARLYWLQVEAALHIFLACLFTYMLVRRLTANKMAAFIAGAVVGFSGHWLQGTKACPNRCVSCPANRVCETGYIRGLYTLVTLALDISFILDYNYIVANNSN